MDYSYAQDDCGACGGTVGQGMALTNLEVMGSIPDGVIDLILPAALGSAQPLTWVSPRE